EDCNTNGVPDECEFSLNSQYSNVVAPDGSAADQFGFSVDIEGTIGVIGAQWGSKTGVSRSGSAYVFQEIDGVWQYEMEITASDAAFDDRFGYSVSISGNTIVVGANRNDDDGTNSGSAYIFRSSNGVWQQIAKVTANDASSSDFFGTSVAIAGNTVLIGAHGNDDDGSRSGSAYVFREIGGIWQQIAKLTADDASSDNFFGHTLALAGDTAVIGAYGGTETGVDESGAAYVFSDVEGVWQQIEKLTASDAASGDRFGFDVAIHGNTIVVGAYLNDAQPVDTGAAYVFRETGGIWSQIAKLTVDDLPGGDYLGFSVAIHGSRIALGAPLNSENGPESGAVYATREVGGVWRQPTRIATFNSDTDDELGSSVALNGDSVLVGAYKDIVTASNKGSAHFHSFGIPDCNTNGILDECDIESGVETDCNLNGIPDACEPFGENSQDCSFLDDVCVLGVCNLEAGACETIPANEGGLCDDLDSCTTDDFCVSGICTGSEIDCSLLDSACLLATCNSKTGLCEPPALTDCNVNGTPDECELFDVQHVATFKDSLDHTVFGNEYVKLGASVAFRKGETFTGGPISIWTLLIVGDPNYRLELVCTDNCPGQDPDPCEEECEGGELVGTAQVWEEFDGIWASLGEIGGDQVAGEKFGASMDFGGGTLLIGAPGTNSVYVYDSTFFPSHVATLSVGTGQFGDAVAVDGTTALIGAPRDDVGGSDTGSAYIFEKANGEWQQSLRLNAADAQPSDRFGNGVSISGNVAVIGAHGDDDGGSGSGSAYIFERANGTWQQIAKLTADDASADDAFGDGVAIDGVTVIIGAFLDDDDDAGADSGSAYIFRKIDGVWQQIAKLTAADAVAGAQFGVSVAIEGKSVVIGARYDDGRGNRSGASYVFREIGGVWTQIKKLTGPDTDAEDYFGASTAIDGGIAVFGASGARHSHANLVDYGAAYVFEIENRDCNDNVVPDECDTGEQANPDCNINGIADGCEIDISNNDCNLNGVPDDCDIEDQNSPDCNLNGIPDECEPYSESSFDCSFLDDVCVVGICNLATGSCETAPANNGLACDDENPCTDSDACSSGECAGALIDCSQFDIECLPASCNPETGFCESPEVLNDCNTNGTPDECELILGPPKLTAPDGEADDEFGYSVEIDGVTGVIGAPFGLDNVVGYGKAYVYRNVGGSWQYVTKIKDDNDAGTSDRFGFSVSISGNTIVIGADRYSGAVNGNGTVYIYRLLNGLAQRIAQLTANDPGNFDYFGSSVAIDGDTVLIGARADDVDGINNGSAYVFREINGVWQQIAKLTADDASPDAFFGRRLDFIGDTAVIGAHRESKTGVSESGAAYVFREIGGVWQQIAKLTADDAASGDAFGVDVAIDGNTIVVGAHGDDEDATNSGSAYIFREINGVWQQIEKLRAGDPSDNGNFGFSVAIHEDRAIFGALRDNEKGTESGAVYVSREIGGIWQQPFKFTADDGAANDRLGISVAISGNAALVGAYRDDDNGSNSGSAYVFNVASSDCNTNGSLDECDIANGTSSDCNGNGVPDDCEAQLIDASPSANECPGTVITLDAGAGYGGYSWEPGGETSRTIQVTTPGTYRATVTGSAGSCVTSYSIGVAFSGSEPGVPAVLVSSKLTNSVVAIDAQTGKMLFEYIPPATNGLNDPNGITVDSAGHVYVSSVNTQSVMKFAAFTGELIREYTGALTDPVGLLIADPDTLLVSNWSDDSVHKFDVVTGQALGQLVASGAGGLDGPADLLLTPAGELLVSSQKSDRVLAYDAESGASSHIAAQGGGLETPAGLLLDSQGNLLVASFSTDQVLRFDPSTGTLIDVFVGDDPTTISVDESGGLDGSEGLAWSANGNLLVSNRYGASVLEYDGTTGTFVRALGTGKVNQPTYLTMTSLDRDCNEDRIPDYCDTDTGVAGMDCNFNGIGDKCDAASVGDFDANGTLDLIDFGYLADCQAGPGTSSTPSDGGCVAMCFQVFDADADGDIDLQDFAAFQMLFDP
ncbi:MAG: hypothetical protein GXP29_05875, partial [Planctomycetes bacterium]|nr:hypothetical protein [Planctomycetota bacterium]